MKYALVLIAILSCATARAQSYWQQHVSTKIEVQLDDRNHMLHGYEEIVYTNNSPDTLRYIYMHLWPNAYKHDHTQFAEQQYRTGDKKFYYAKNEERGYIDSLQFTIGSANANYISAENTPDIARIDLPTPLAPGQNVTITTPFRVKIPTVFSRLGHTNQAYFISQWFPKPAVYDRRGWHPISYLDLGEFYSEVGSYDVTITLPDNYIVMATGNCTDVTENAWLDSLARKVAPADTMYAKSWPASSGTMKTLHFTEDNVHDFAWFADKRWIVRADSQMVAPLAGVNPDSNMVKVYTAFLPSYQKSWKLGTTHLKNTLLYYGKWVGPYPYHTIKAVQGDMNAGGGMEYPTVTVIDRSVGGSESVIVHEAGHNWFYGILATNERDHAWMDEGINSFYEFKTTDATKQARDTSGKRRPNVTEQNIVNIAYFQLAATNEDQPIDQTSNAYAELNYGIDVYYKSAMMLKWLEHYMGPANFEAAMQDYYETWRFKHPYPEDFEAIFRKHTDKNLDWWFDQILRTTRKIDFAIKGANDTEVKVKNNTSLNIPVGITAWQDTVLLGSVWSAPFTGTTRLTLPDSMRGYNRLNVAYEVPDGRYANNYYRTKGLFHGDGLRIRPGVGLNLGNKERMWVLPAIGYNDYDHFQLGLLFHNLTIPQSRFRFVIAPLYAFGSKAPTGAASLGYFFYPQRGFKEVLLQLDAKSFHYTESALNRTEPLHARYTKIAPSINFIFKEPEFISPVTRTLTLKAYSITEDYFLYTQSPADSLFRPSVAQQHNIYGLLRYTHMNNRTFNPFSYKFEAQAGQAFAKLTLEGKVRIDYHLKNKALRVRAFAGKFFTLDNSIPFAAERYWLNTTFTGVNDYLYDDTYIGRTESTRLPSQQISMREGGFKIPTPLYASPLGRSDNWLATLNVETDLPLGFIPLRLFLDAGTFTNAGTLNPSGSKFLYAGGVSLNLPFDVFNIYFPFVFSPDYKDYMTTIHGKNRVPKSMVFTLNLQNINWLKVSNKVLNLVGE